MTSTRRDASACVPHRVDNNEARKSKVKTGEDCRGGRELDRAHRLRAAVRASSPYLGFAAAHWRKGDLDQLHEWGLGGRRFGTLITWFLIGGDLYTAYTFIAVPALAFGAGAIAFFAVPYTILIYPILFLVFPRLWHVCHKHNYITAGGFRARPFRQSLAGAGGRRSPALSRPCPISRCNWSACRSSSAPWAFPAPAMSADLPLIIAFIILAAFTYSSGLRAPASIAIVKDILIYITAFAAVIVVPIQLGGFGKIFAAVPPAKAAAGGARRQHHRPLWRLCDAGAGLGAGAVPLSAFHHRHPERVERPRHPPQRGDAAGLFLHARPAGAGRLLRHRRRSRRDFRNLPAASSSSATTSRCRRCILHSFPSWFVGIAFAAIGIGALVPAAIMSIAAANLYTRNIHREFINKNPTDKQEAQMAKWVSLIVKFGALVFILFVPTQYRHPLPAAGRHPDHPDAAVGDARASIPAGSTIGRCSSAGRWAPPPASAMFVAANLAPTYPLAIGGHTFPGYSALYTVILNLVIAIVLTPVFNAMGGKRFDETVAADYHA